MKGTGSIFWSPSRNAYVGKVIIGTYPGGKPKYVQRSDATVGGLQAKLALVKPPSPGTTICEWLDTWLTEMKCKPATRRLRVSAITHHLKPSLGHLKVTEVTPRQIEVAAAGWKKMVGGIGLPLNANTVNLVLGILSTAMRAAIRAELRKDNPVKTAYKPRGVKKKVDPFSLDEIDRITIEAASKPNTRPIAVLAVTGMRVGEVLALDVTDVNLKAATLNVTKTFGMNRKMGPPKSPNSVRVVEVPPDPPKGVAALRDACRGRISGPVFRTRTGRRTGYEIIQDAWTRLLTRLSIRHRTLHQLRHSFASHSIAAKVDVAEVAKHLGNTAQEVVATYLHPTGTTNAAKAFAALFRGSRGDHRVTPGTGKPTKSQKSRAKRGK